MNGINNGGTLVGFYTVGTISHGFVAVPSALPGVVRPGRAARCSPEHRSDSPQRCDSLSGRPGSPRSPGPPGRGFWLLASRQSAASARAAGALPATSHRSDLDNAPKRYDRLIG